MPRILGLFPSALTPARGEESASAWIRQMQSIGMGARRSEMFELYKLARGIVSRSPEEIFRDITQVPTASEIQVWPTRKAEGFAQLLPLSYLNRTPVALPHTS